VAEGAAGRAARQGRREHPGGGGAMSEPKSRMIELGSNRPTLELQEAGSGPPLFFLHGAGGVSWDGGLSLLARHFHVYAPSLPGFGKSPADGLEKIEDALELWQLGFDLIEKLGLDKPLVVGESFGGWMAAEMAALRPKEVGKLVLMAPVGVWRDAQPVVDIFGLTIGELLPFLFHDMNSAPAKAMAGLTSLMSDKDDRTQAQIDALIALFLGFRTAAKFLFPVPDTGVERRLWRIRVPTLVLWGAQDKLIAPSYADVFAKNVKNAQVVMIERCGHLPLAEQAETAAKEIARFAGV
jgi:pimeloyl-ACP methyl ester carboxylesterase